MLASMQSVLSIIIMIAVGYVISEFKWVDKNSSNLIVKIVVNISLPSLMFYTIITNFTKKQLLSSADGLLIPVSSIIIAYILGIITAKIIHVQASRKGLFTSLFFNSNTIFMGLPINLALFGEKSVPYVLLYYIANTTFFWTFGVYEISKDGDKEHAKLFSFETIKKIISPPLMGYVLSIIFILIGIKMPSCIMNSLMYLGNLTTPLSMIFIGITIYSVNIKAFKMCREMLGVLAGRFLVSPVLVILLAMFFSQFFNVPHLMRDVFVIQAAMPAMTNSSIVSKAYNADYEFAAIMISVTTILSVIILPIYMVILSKI